MDFSGKTNKDYIWINTLTFRLKSGKEVTIDREWTQYSIEEDGSFGMTWRGCYFWDDEHNNCNNLAYLTEEDMTEIENAELVDIYVDEDADTDYEVTIDGWYR